MGTRLTEAASSQSFNRAGNAPRVQTQRAINNAGHTRRHTLTRGPMGTRLNEASPIAIV
ncbi:hypothetical protein EC9_14390 [Rosistilla ulvae]|uniref:Uncharacterized protein n=1 Tax=Rosistilla ulvae TaxID=1930277 RepID=A0A517LX96_9BACT|nr:hypothetical protein EC9_14390 [Rosistilla ulvae]